MDSIYNYYAIAGISPGAKKQWSIINNVDRRALKLALDEHYNNIVKMETHEGHDLLVINQSLIVGGRAKEPETGPNVLIL